MKKLLAVLTIALALLTIQTSFAKKTKAQFSPIKVITPTRSTGQKDVLQLITPKLETVRVGFIGLGMRGPSAVECWTHIPRVQIVALCNLLPEQAERSQNILKNIGLPEAASYSGSEDAWKKLCECNDIDLVYIATDWKHHANMGIYAMEHDKHVAIEVPSAMTLEEIWELINTSEKTRKHCMQLENCVYDFFKLTTLNMAQQGVFGDVLHVEGAYIHNLENLNAHSSVSEDVKNPLMAKYKNPILDQELEETAKKVGGHGGIDYIMDYRLVYCLRDGLPLDMDVYDLAERCCMTDLTKLSIENGSAPVEIPDFTRGGRNKVKGFRYAFNK